MKIAITGATGYIGQRLVHAAILSGHQVLALSRRPVARPGVAWQRFDLHDTEPPSLSADIDVLVHLAAKTSGANDATLDEVSAAKLLADAACLIGARFVFVSSQTARADAPTAYGLTKWRIERLALDAGGLVLRPGLVYGGPTSGLFGTLCTLVQRLPILPAFIPAPVVQPVHVDDLVTALLACLTHPPSTLLNVASREPVSFTAFLRAIARGRTTKRPIFIPVPVLLIHILARLSGQTLRDKLGLERLRSLFALRYMDTNDDLRRLSLRLRPMSAGMTRSGRDRRELVREARALFTYLLRMEPVGTLVRRYVRAVEAIRRSGALLLPGMFFKAPILLALLDGAMLVNTNFIHELNVRLGMALTLAEASPQGAIRFLDDEGRTSWLRNAVLILRAGSFEIARRLFQLPLTPLISRLRLPASKSDEY